jgi:hypothetical protein
LKIEAQATPQRLTASTSPLRVSLEDVVKARGYAQAATTPVVYVALKLIDKKNDEPSDEDDKGGEDYE